MADEGTSTSGSYQPDDRFEEFDEAADRREFWRSLEEQERAIADGEGMEIRDQRDDPYFEVV